MRARLQLGVLQLGVLQLGVLLFASACDGGDDADAGGGDAGGRCDAPLALTPGDAEGHPSPLGAGAAEARAGRLTASDLPAGPGVDLPWEPGDYVLANDRVALAIEAVRVSDGFDPYGGMPIGVASVEGGALVAPADFSEVMFTFGAAALEPDSVSVIADGSGGGPAIVRAIGRARTLGFLDFLSGIVGTEVPDVQIAIDYALSPGASSVEVTVRGVNETARSVGVRQPFLFAFQQNRMPKLGPGYGFDVPSGEPVPFVVFTEDRATSYGFESARADLRVYIEQNNLLGILLPRFGFEPCSETATRLGSIFIGRDGVDGALLARDSTRSRVTGAVTTSAGEPVLDGHVHAFLPDGTYLTRASIAEGAFALHVPAGEVRLRAYRAGDPPSEEVTATAPADAVAIALPPAGAVRVQVSDVSDGAPIPALIQAIPLDAEAFAPPAEWGERRTRAGRSGVAYGVGDPEVLRVPVGRHRIVASRGPEWELASAEVEVTDGAVLDVALTLEHVVDTPGVMCGDFHIHTNRSFDARDALDLKLRAAAAEGLEIPVRSEHEWVADFEPPILARGLEEHLYGMGSLELTTFVYGHFGVFPLDVDPAARNGGAVEWVGLDPPAVFRDAESRSGRFGGARVMINHPRSALSILGYFNAAGYDPVTGVAAAEDLWWDEFRLHEVFNDSDYDANEVNVADWYSFLARGRRVVAVGSSDSHQLATSPIGYPRTCIALGLDSPAALRAGGGAGLVRDRLLDGAAAINGGVTVEATARGGASLGDTVEGAMAQESVTVVVRAPLWVPVDRLRVVVDGAVQETIALDATTRDPLEPTVRFRADVQVDLAGPESFVVLVADGDGDLEPVTPRRRPFGVTNPIFFRR